MVTNTLNNTAENAFQYLCKDIVEVRDNHKQFASAKKLLSPLTKAIYMYANKNHWHSFNCPSNIGVNASAAIEYDCWELVSFGVIWSFYYSNEKIISEEELSELYKIDKSTIASEGLLKKHNEICKQLKALYKKEIETSRNIQD